MEYIDICRYSDTSDRRISKYDMLVYFKIGGENLSLYLFVHTWKKEDFKVVGRKVIESMPQLPKGATPVNIVTDARQTGAWCIYETENTEELNKFWEKNVPEMHTTGVVPVMQFFPPGPDLYKIIHIIASQ